MTLPMSIGNWVSRFLETSGPVACLFAFLCSGSGSKTQSMNCFRSLIFAALALASMTTSDTLAQTVTVEDLLRQCAAENDITARYQCYDMVLRSEASDPNTPPLNLAPQAVPQAPPVTPPATANRSTRPPSEFGLPERRQEPDSITVSIVDLDITPLGRAVFTTADGQIWVQQDTQRPFRRSTPFQANIRKATMGGYFIKPEKGGYSLRASRAQ